MSGLGQKLPSAPPPIYVRSWGNPDVISTKADIDTHAAWLADRNWPTLSRTRPTSRRAGAARGDLRPGDSPSTPEGEIALQRVLSGPGTARTRRGPDLGAVGG